MKLFTKISLIVAAIALGLGVLGIAIGMGMGADVRDLSEMGIYLSPYHQIHVTSAITKPEGIEERMQNHKHEKGVLHSYSTVTEDIRRLEVDVEYAEICVFATEEEELCFDSNRKQEIGRMEGNTLILEEETFPGEPLSLEIYIPTGMLKEIEIEAAGGSLTADLLAADKVSIEMDTGEVEVNQLIAGEQAEIHTNAGKIVVGFFEGTKLELDCDMGSILVVCEGRETDYNYNLECDVGSIQIGTKKYSGIGKEMKIQNNSSKKIEADCDMGEIILEFPNSL